MREPADKDLVQADALQCSGHALQALLGTQLRRVNGQGFGNYVSDAQLRIE
jgi:hypothetical protein